MFNQIYEIFLVNAKSNGNIPARYQDKYMSNSFDIVLIFCDTDRNPYHDYSLIKEKINDFHGNNISDEVILFANPCTMQIILSHFKYVSLTTQNKRKNSPLIKELTNIDNY